MVFLYNIKYYLIKRFSIYTIQFYLLFIIITFIYKLIFLIITIIFNEFNVFLLYIYIWLSITLRIKAWLPIYTIIK